MRTLRRPMFRIGGKAEVGNDGIMSGLVDREELQAGTPLQNVDATFDPFYQTPNMDQLRAFQSIGMGNPFRAEKDMAGRFANIFNLRPADPKKDIVKNIVDSAPIVQEKKASETALSTQEQLRPYQKYFSGNLEDVLKQTTPKVEVPDEDTTKIGTKDTGSNVVTQAEKNAILKARAEEFEELLNPGARKRVINNALAAASAQFGKSTGNTMQDIANAITAAAGATSEIDKTKQKAAELAIGESIQKGIAAEKAKAIKPNATESLINFYKSVKDTKGNRVYSDEDISNKISKTSESELDYIRAYPVASQGKAAYVSNVEMKGNELFGGVLSNDKKQRKEELKTLNPDKLYYDSSQDAYVKIVTGDDGKQTVQIVSKR
jgi:hypothetical protein